MVGGGIGLILLALFAFQLGLDNDPSWGPRRTQLLLAGLAVAVFGGFHWISPYLSRWYPRRFSSVLAPFHPTSPPALSVSATRSTDILLLIIGIAAIWAYIFVITAGKMDEFPRGWDYYWQLTQAFQNGQTHLLAEPSADLLALENPYDYQQRKEIGYLWDASLYNGRYYLYWGPVPAVLGVLVNGVTSRPVTDEGLVLTFVIGIAFFSILLLRRLYLDRNIPVWVFWGGVFASFLNVPLIWLLTRPSFYEASIAGGQFFLMAGFYWLYTAFRTEEPNKFLLFLSALAFASAGGTRINLLPAVVFLAIFTAWRIYISGKRVFFRSIPALLAVALPLMITAAGLAWYNHDRFGSIFEFGHKYQLTGPALTADYRNTGSIRYILPNAYTYLFRPPVVENEFPFLRIPWIKEDMWPFFIRLPEHYYYTEPVAGLLLIIPPVGWAALLLLSALWSVLNGDTTTVPHAERKNSNTSSWIMFPMLGYVLIQLLILLVFINSAMRYLVDISSVLIVLSAIFAAYYTQMFASNVLKARLNTYVWIFASILTFIFGFLSGFTGDRNNFLNKNPQLFYQLFEWFNF